MHRVDLKHIPLKTGGAPRLRQAIGWTCFGLFLAAVALCWLRAALPQPPLGEASWPEGVLLLLATATTLATLGQQLPGQNVLLASVVIAAAGAGIHTVGILWGVPFGPVQFSLRFGPVLFPPLPWGLPFLWLVLILNARGVGRLILRPWRQGKNYGLWLIGVTALLVVLFEMALEPFGTQVMQYWSWKPTKLHSDWFTTPWPNFLGWAISSLLILAFVTPALIHKKPAKRPPQFQPLVVWWLLNLLLLTALVQKQLWPAAIVAGVNIVVPAGLVVLAALKVRRKAPAPPTAA